MTRRQSLKSDQQRVNSLEKVFQLSKLGPRKEEIARARGALEQAQGQADYAKSLLDATVIRAPVTGTILERAAEKGELVTSGFASTAEGGPQGLGRFPRRSERSASGTRYRAGRFRQARSKAKGVVTVDAYPDLKWDGIIAEISPASQPRQGDSAGEGANSQSRRPFAAGYECHGKIS